MKTIYTDVEHLTGALAGTVSHNVPQCTVADADEDWAVEHYSKWRDAAIEIPLLRGGSALIVGDVVAR